MCGQKVIFTFESLFKWKDVISYELENNLSNVVEMNYLSSFVYNDLKEL